MYNNFITKHLSICPSVLNYFMPALTSFRGQHFDKLNLISTLPFPIHYDVTKKLLLVRYYFFLNE